MGICVLVLQRLCLAGNTEFAQLKQSQTSGSAEPAPFSAVLQAPTGIET